MLEDPSLEVVSAVLQALPKIVAYCKPQNEKMVRHIITFCLEKGPDFIRAQTVSSILSLVDVDRASGTSLLRTASSLSDWRVRYAVCSSVGIIGEKLGTTVFASFLVKNIGSYLTDQNPDTRISAMETFPLLCKYAEADLLASEIVNGLTHIASDTEVTVKIALATYLPCLITKLGKKKFNEFFLPLILALLRDEAVDVKAAMVGHFGPIFEVIGPNVLLDAVEPAFIDLSKCVLWRHKRTCLTFLCAVAESGGREAVRDSLVKVLVDLVKDDFESVREVVVETIKRLRDCLKEDWLAANVLPEVEK